MEIQFITDAQGKKTAAIVPFDEWERTEKAKEILEHVYLDGIIKERRDSKPTVNLDDLLTAEGLTRADSCHCEERKEGQSLHPHAKR